MVAHLRRSAPFSLMILLMISSSAANDVYLPALPAVTRELFVSNSYSQMTIVIFAIGYGIGQFFVGPLSDMMQRKWVLLATLFAGALTSLLLMFPTALTMLPLRFLQGFFFGSISVIGSASVREMATDTNDLSAKLAVAMVFVLLGPILAPPLGGFLLHFIHWSTLFGIAVVYNAVLIALILPFRMPQRGRSTFRSTLKGLYAITGHAPTLLYILAQSLIYGTLLVFLYTFPIIYEAKYHVSPTDMGLMFGAFGLVGILSAALNSLIMRLRIITPSHFAVWVSLFVAISVSVGAIFVHTVPLNMWQFALVEVPLIFGIALNGPTLYALAVEKHLSHAGSAAGIIGAGQLTLGSLFALTPAFFTPSNASVFISFLPLTWGAAVCVLWAFYLTRRAELEPQGNP